MKPEAQDGPKRQTDSLIVSIADYQSPASRIRGFKELFQYNLTAPRPMLVVGHSAFESYLRYGGLSPNLERVIGDAFDEIIKQNPTRGAYIGRAFFVPGIDNPNGPRTAGITDKARFITEAEKFYRYVIDEGYNKVKGSDIALILHPFINVMDHRAFYGTIPIKENERLPWAGGYAVPDPVPGQKSRVKIVATFGPDEAIQSCPSDVYIVDPKRATIISKSVALKTETFVPVEGNRYNSLTIPLDYQAEQALTDADCLQVAAEAQKVFERRPQSRIEFIQQEDGVYIREIAPWEMKNGREHLHMRPGELFSAPVIRVESPEDADRIPSDIPTIVYFAPAAFRRRTTDIFARVAHVPRSTPLYNLIYGTVETSHMARILEDSGHSVIHVGTREYADGDVVEISKRPDGTPHVEFADPYHKAVIPFENFAFLQGSEAGQKVRRLSMLKHFGIPVPDGFGVTSKAIHQWLTDIGLAEQIARLDTVPEEDSARLEKISSYIRKRIYSEQQPERLLSQINQAISKYSFPSYAIRSSGSEDGEKQSLAGLYQSVVDVKPNNVPHDLKKTVASYFSSESIKAVRRMGMQPSAMTIGVGIHEFIPEKRDTVGFVAFTSQDGLHIDFISGSPTTLVGGTATDYLHLDINRTSGEQILKPYGKPMLSLSANEIRQLALRIMEIETVFKGFQDIEGIVDPTRGPIFVQTRPL